MTPRIAGLKQNILSGKYQLFRQSVSDLHPPCAFPEDLPGTTRAAQRLAWMLEQEQPVVFPGEQLALLRTVPVVPAIFNDREVAAFRQQGVFLPVNNLCPDYATTLRTGLGAQRREISERLADPHSALTESQRCFLGDVLTVLDAMTAFALRYADAAATAGLSGLSAVLRQIATGGARTFHEALQLFRLLHFCLWASGTQHNTIGRFDLWMYPYLAADLKAGRLDEPGAFELLEEFFLTFSRDAVLYPGVQRGDNGQSMVLGGTGPDGAPVDNMLTRMCLKASLDLAMTDPKINLRVCAGTDPELFLLGTELTRRGLGFPQYSNDDVVIPGLTALGYAPEDARNYAIAACWEYIIPGRGMEVPNIHALSFPGIVNQTLENYLECSPCFADLMHHLTTVMHARLRSMSQEVYHLRFEPSPLMSLLMEGCIAHARDISEGSIYNNYGFHGSGLSTAADSLAAVSLLVYEEKCLSPRELLDALAADFTGYDDLHRTLLDKSPRMGRDDSRADDIACTLLEIFASGLEGLTNSRGGRIRAGSGSAMFYLWHGRELGATADGRRRGEPLAANFSPTWLAGGRNPLTVLRSFSKPDMRRIVNGGPLTLELSDSVFLSPDSTAKVAGLVRAYMAVGGQQLQLNAVNPETLKDAQLHPERYPHLIVRVWGWSGYFTELEKPYQDQIIHRTAHGLSEKEVLHVQRPHF